MSSKIGARISVNALRDLLGPWFLLAVLLCAPASSLAEGRLVSFVKGVGSGRELILSLGPPVSFLSVHGPCFRTKKLIPLLQKFSFRTASRGITRNASDSGSSLFEVWVHDDGKYGIVISDPQRKLSCITTTGDGFENIGNVTGRNARNK